MRSTSCSLLILKLIVPVLLFVLNSEFLGSLKIGNFAFVPRSNGNLSLKLSTATTPDIEDEETGTE